MKERILQTCQDAQSNLELVLWVLGGLAILLLLVYIVTWWSDRLFEKKVEKGYVQTNREWRETDGYV